MKHALIIAGGIGTRFWPLSRNKTPKHLAKGVLNEKTLIENTIDRIKPLISTDKIHVVTNIEQIDEIKQTLPYLNNKQFIIEPLRRDTAPAIGYGAINLLMEDPDATMIILPSDHYIGNHNRFLNLIERAVNYIENNQDKLVTIGIRPRYAETGYGYIQTGNKISENCYEVSTFAEKPNYKTALRFVESGDFFWNSGIFVWKAKTILNKIQKFMPELYDSLLSLQDELKKDIPLLSVITNHYNTIIPKSIDYGVMEKSNQCTVFIGEYYWSDVGSWQEIFRLNEKDEHGNVVKGKAVNLNTKDSLIYNSSEEKVVCTIGLDNLFIVNTDDSILIAPMEKSQDVKQMVEILKAKNMNKNL